MVWVFSGKTKDDKKKLDDLDAADIKAECTSGSIVDDNLPKVDPLKWGVSVKCCLVCKSIDGVYGWFVRIWNLVSNGSVY